ncbi:MAG: Xaa-Pro peptidase family protein [Deltaproteobacteria bacterium]|nr:Xaa-Pro peptidase family protein [Deltaproteobacteria bacterium]
MACDPNYLSFSDAEYERRHAAVKARMDRMGLDAVVFYGSRAAPDIHYLCNWLTTSEAYFIYPGAGEPTLFVQLSNHLPNARRMALIDDVRFGGSSPTGSVDSVPRVLENLKDRGLEKGSVGLCGSVPYRHYLRLVEALPGVKWSDFSAEMRDQRQVKSDEEIERLRQASAMSDDSVAALAEHARPGIPEHELARIVEDVYLGKGGINGIHFMITTSMHDPKGGVPQQHLSNRILRKGDVLVTEISTNYAGYTGQVLRTFTIGEDPTPEYQRLHDTAMEAFDRIAGVIKAGAGTEEVLQAADVVHERGFTVYDDVVHGASQLPPILRTHKTQRGVPPDFRFQTNMCLVIQPNVVTDDGLRGVQFGEMMRVTDTGLENMHDCPRQLFVCRNG